MSDINVQTFSGKVNVTNNLLVGSSHLFVDTVGNKVGITTASPDAGLHVNSNAYVNTDFRVGSSIIMNDTAGQITAGSFVGDGSAMTGINSDSGSWVNGTGNVYLSTTTDKVGIGTSDPPCLLTIDGGTGVDSSGGVLCIKQKGDTVNDGITLTSSHANSTRMYKDANGHFNLHNTGGGSFLFENVTGNVGIGGRAVGLLAPLHVSITGRDYGGYTNTPLDMSKDMFRIGNRIANNPTYDDNEYGIQFGVSGSGNSSIQTYVYDHSTTSTTASYSLLLQPNGGNVGIGTTSPSAELDVNGTIQTPLLNMNGTTMSKAPRVIHIDDTRSGCPPTWAANTPIMEYSLTLSRTAYVYVSVTTILNYTARADCYIYFNNSLQQSHLTASDNTSWNPVNITAGGSLGAGTHTIKFQCNVANVVGCQSSWGGMQILVFEQ